MALDCASVRKSPNSTVGTWPAVQLEEFGRAAAAPHGVDLDPSVRQRWLVLHPFHLQAIARIAVAHQNLHARPPSSMERQSTSRKHFCQPPCRQKQQARCSELVAETGAHDGIDDVGVHLGCEADAACTSPHTKRPPIRLTSRHQGLPDLSHRSGDCARHPWLCVASGVKGPFIVVLTASRIVAERAMSALPRANPLPNM